MLRRLAPLLAALTLALVAAGSAVAAPAGASAATAATARASTLELGIVRELNRVRAANGLRPVRISKALTAAAVGHSAAMLASGLFDHTSADGTAFDRRLARYYPVKGFASWTVGENLLFDAGDLAAADAVQAWMDSPPHRGNMLNAAFREVGVGAVQAQAAPGDFGGGPALVITLDFGARIAAAR